MHCTIYIIILPSLLFVNVVIIIMLHIGGEQFIFPVDSRATSFLRQNYCTKPTLVSANFEECAMFILSEMNHCVPSNLEEACSGYFCITKYIELNS